MAEIEYTDLLIIGAGPAGLSTALHLIQEDPSWKEHMILLEKETHPRSKLCGGGITRIGLQTLRDLHFPLPLPIDQSRVDNIYLKYKSRIIHVRGKPLFVVFDRPAFDHYLVQQIKLRGIRIHEDEPALSISINQNHILVHSNKRDYRAKMVVIADGTSGAISNAIKDTPEPKRISRTLEIWAPASSTSPRFLQQSALFDFDYLSSNLQGYYWEFPSKVSGKLGHNRGVYDSRMARKKNRANLTGILGRALDTTNVDAIIAPLKGATIQWFSPRNTVSKTRAILVGDAAGVDVLFGEGISPSLLYGKIAAKEICHAFHNNNFNFSTYKQKLLTSRLGRYLLIRWLVAIYIYHLGDRALFSHLLWTIGQILASIWRCRRLY